MLRTQVYLSEAQDKGLKKLARTTGRSQSALIREAIDKLIEAQPVEDWKASLLSAAGAWKDNPDAEAIIREGREQTERRIDRLWRRS
jgi:predicted transcriptional regulator